MAPSPGRNYAAVIFAVLSASGGALFAFYIYKRIRQLRSQRFPKRIATAISNEQLANVAKSTNVSLRQSAEQMLLDRILEREAFQVVIKGCYSKDENELYKACSVFCVVLKSVNFSVPLPLTQIVKLLTSCLQRSLDRESHFEIRSQDSIFAVKIQRMTLATVCDFLSDSVTRKDVLVTSCPEIISVCVQLVDESKNKEVLRYSVLLLFQIAGLGTTREVREAGAIPVLAKRIITFHGDQIMQRITLQTIVVLLGSEENSKPYTSQIANATVLMPTVSSCISDDVELSFWSLALIQDFVNNDLCTDELTQMSYLVKNFHTILKTKEGAFKSFVLKMLGGLCERRESFAKELTSNKALLETVTNALQNPNDLVVNYCIKFLKILMQGGQSAIENLLDVPDHSILKGLLHIAKEGQIENKLLMTELLTELVISEKFVARIVKNGGLDIVKALAKWNSDDSLCFFSSAMLIDMAMISDEVKGLLAKKYILPIVLDWIKTAKNEKVAVFATKTLVMLHLIDDILEMSIHTDGKSTKIDVDEVHFEDAQHSVLKVFHWNSLLAEEITNVPVQKKSLSATEDQVNFQVPILDNLTAENAGEIIFVTLSGKEGSKYVQGLLKYIQMSKEEEEQCLNLNEEDVAVLIAKVDEDGRMCLMKMSTASSETKATFSIPYKKAFQERTQSRVLRPIMEKLRRENSHVGCPLGKNELDVLNVLLCLESYLNIFISAPSILSNLLATLQHFNIVPSENIMVFQSIIDVLVTVSTFESGRQCLISQGAPMILVNLMNSQLECLSVNISPIPKNDVFDTDLVGEAIAVSPRVAAVIKSLPPRPQSRAEPRPLVSEDGLEVTTDSRIQVSSSSTNASLPIIPEDGFITPEVGELAEPVNLYSTTSEVKEVFLSGAEEPKNENENGKGNDDLGSLKGPTTKTLIQNVSFCLAKILSGKLSHVEADEHYQDLAATLCKSGTVYTMWAYLLSSKKELKGLKVPIETAIAILSHSITIELTTPDAQMRLDHKDGTRALFMSTDDLEVLNYNWTFESVRTNVGVSQPSIPSPSRYPKGWFYQMELYTDGLIQVGWCNDSCQYAPRKGIGIGDDYNSYSFDGVRKKKWHGPVAEQTEENSYGELWKTGDIVTCLLDYYGNISYHLNGQDIGVAFPAIDMRARWYPACSVCTEQWARFNFGDEPIRFPEAIPDGFVPVSDSLKQSFQHPPEDTEHPSTAKEDANSVTLSNEKGGTPEEVDKDDCTLETPATTDENILPSKEGATPISEKYLPSLYYEVKVNRKTARSFVLGFSTLNSSNQVIVVIKESEMVLPDLTVKQIPAERNFVVGCGYVATTNHVFFTIDGEVIELFFEFTSPIKSPVTPCLSSVRVTINWGQRDFKFKIANLEDYSKGAVSTCRTFLFNCQNPESDNS